MTCNHKHPSLSAASIYACVLSFCFVFNLYLLVPKQVTKLPRSDIRQIKWRILSVMLTIMLAISTYPYLFCKNEAIVWRSGFGAIKNVLGWRSIDRATFVPLLHVGILYFGSFVTSIIQHRLVYITKRDSYEHSPEQNFFRFMSRRVIYINTQRFSDRWQSSRDFFVAPLAEEIIFRACIIPPFLLSGRISIVAICWVTPLFFGVAHAHHAVTKMRNGAPLKAVLFSTLFQLLYTTLFGAYESYCFIKIGSLPALVMVHSFCNFMGLPDVSLLFGVIRGNGDERLMKSVKIYRFLSGIAYIFGIVFFWLCFSHGTISLFPQGYLLQERLAIIT
jgi:prenyl protein peptidase